MDSLLGSPLVKDIVARTGMAMGTIYAGKTDTVHSWLGSAAAGVLSYLDSFLPPGPGRPTGVWLAVVSHESMNAAPAMTCATFGYSDHATAEQVQQTAQRWSQGARFPQGLITTTMGPEPSAAGLVMIARVIQPLRWAGVPRWLVLQADGPQGAVGAGKGVALAGELLLPLIAGAMEQTVARLETHRRELIRRVSASQQGILPLLATGMSQREIATQIGRSLHTVHDHVKSIYAALGVNSRFAFQRLWNAEPFDAGDED